jgi:hypothetical protein
MKEAEPLGIKARACLDPERLVEGDGCPGCCQPTFALAGFQLRLHLDDGLAQSDEPLLRLSCLLHISPSLSRGKLSICCMVLLIEVGLPIV